jgi:hypothetical protein
VVLLQGGKVALPAAVYAQTATAAISLVFVILCVNSFIQARIRRRRAASPQS